MPFHRTDASQGRPDSTVIPAPRRRTAASVRTGRSPPPERLPRGPLCNRCAVLPDQMSEAPDGCDQHDVGFVNGTASVQQRMVAEGASRRRRSAPTGPDSRLEWVVRGGLEPPTFRFSVRQRFSRYLAEPLPNNALRPVSAVAGASCCGTGCGRLPASWRSDSWGGRGATVGAWLGGLS
jgi:hypothetical protein